jgi:hypothetical protein
MAKSLIRAPEPKSDSQVWQSAKIFMRIKSDKTLLIRRFCRYWSVAQLPDEAFRG